jgi:hypothetical protein
MSHPGNAARRLSWEIIIPNPDNFTPDEQVDAVEHGHPVLIRVRATDLDAYNRLIRGGELDAQVAKLAAIAAELRQLQAEQPVPQDAVAERVLVRLSDAFAEAASSSHPSHADPTEYVHQNNAPIPKNIYLRLAREGAFPSTKAGKKILAKRVDVVAALEARQRKPPPPLSAGAGPSDDLDSLRDQLGLQRKGG